MRPSGTTLAFLKSPPGVTASKIEMDENLETAPPAGGEDLGHTNGAIRILLVEDDDADALLLRSQIDGARQFQVELQRANTLAEATAALAESDFDAILLDLSLPDAAGFDAIDAIQACHANIPIVVLTGLEDAELERQMLRAGVQDYLPKSDLSARLLCRILTHSIERYRLADQLRLAQREAMSASSAKSDFVAAVSHEIRTPMNAILGMADLLSRTDLSVQQRGYVEIFQRSGKSLLSLINNVLDMSQIESGKLSLSPIEFELFDLIHEAAETFGFQAQRKRLGFVVDIAEGVPERCVGDPDRIRQVLANLAGNAIKFTEEGEIQVSVEVSGDERLRFIVEDSGVGVANDQYESLFEPFEQGGEHIHRRFGGSGLGLTLCRELVTAMGGWIEAGPGAPSGTRVEFDLPLRFVSKEGPAISLAGRRLVVAIKNDAERRALTAQLRRRGATVTVLASGEALEQALRETPDDFDGLVMDIRLPGCDRFMASEDALDRLPPVAIALYPLDHRKTDFAQEGPAGFVKLIKPFDGRELLKVLVTGERTDSVGLEGNPADIDFEPSRILLVDDNPENLLLVETYLSDFPFEVEKAADGSEAIRRFGQDAHFDLILMDMQMPLVDGYEATREIRRLERAHPGTRTPILALSADAFVEHQERARAAGCDGHLAKPIDRRTLVESLGVWLPRRGAAEPAAPEPADPPPAPVMPDIDPAIVDLLPGFIARRLSDLETLHEALESNDFETLRRISHNIKGNGMSFGFPRLSELGAALEERAIEQDAKGFEGGLEELEAEIRPMAKL